MERGQSTIEVILTLPLLVILLWGICELALTFGESSLARYAAYAAARAAIVTEENSRSRRAEQIARQLLTASLGRRVNPLAVTVTCEQDGDGFAVQVGWWRKRLFQGPRRIAASSRLLLEE